MTKKVHHIPQHKTITLTPSTPDTGFGKIYIKDDGIWYGLNDDGIETPLFGDAVIKLGSGVGSSYRVDNENTSSGYYSTVSGGYGNTSSGYGSSIAGGLNNTASGCGSSINGGYNNTASSYYSSVGGGYCNVSSRYYSTVSGGLMNTASGAKSFIGGGWYNTASAYYSIVGGGRLNCSTGYYSTILGGLSNSSTGTCSVVIGGSCNNVSGIASTILGGCGNTLSHDYSAIIGKNITSVADCALHTNNLVISDMPQSDLNNPQVLVRDQTTGLIKYRSVGGGLFAQTVQSTPIAATTVESSLIGTGVGSLSIPANGFSEGESFTAKLCGELSAGNNQTIQIRVKAGSIVLADLGTLTLGTSTNRVWEMELSFTIREIGAAGIAKISTNGMFSYTKNASTTHEGLAINAINTTTFDTTISNTLSITLQWGSNSASNTIHSDQFVLSKTY